MPWSNHIYSPIGLMASSRQTTFFKMQLITGSDADKKRQTDNS